MAHTLKVEIIGNVEGYQRALAKAEASTSSFGSTLAKTIGKAAAFTGLTIGATELAKFGLEAVKSAAEVQKSTEAIKANFGGAADSVLKFSESAAALGLSTKDAEATAVQFGLLFKNMGIGGEQAAKMTIGFEKLGATLSLIKGQNPADVMNALSLAAAGNTRGLKRLGIALDSTQIKNEALKLGLIKTTKEALTPGEKAQSIYALATKNLGEFQRQAAAHAGDFANQQRVLTAEWSNAKDELGAALLPALTKLTAVLAKDLPPAIALVKSVFERIGPTIIALGRYLKDNILVPFKIIVDLLRGDWAGAWDAAKKPIEDISNVITTAFGGIGATIGGYVSDAINAATSFGSGILAGMKSGILGFADWITGRVTAGVQAVKDGLAGALAAATAFGSSILTGMKAGILGFADWVWTRATGAIAYIVQEAVNAYNQALNFGARILQGVKDGIFGLADWVWTRAKAAWGYLVSEASTAYNKALAFGGKIFDGVKDGVADLYALIKDPLQKAWGWLQSNADAIYNAAKAVGSAIWRGIKDGAGGVLGFLQSIIDKIKAVASAIASLPGNIGGHLGFGNTGIDPPGPPHGQPNARGGPVKAGWQYLVGERGPEMFVPSVSGRIIPNNALGSSMFGGGRGMNITINVRAETDDPARLARAIVKPLHTELLRYGLANVSTGLT